MNESEEAKLFRVVDILVRRTTRGEIPWEKRATSDDDKESYAYSTTTSTVSISNDTESGYLVFTVKNEEAFIIGELKVTGSTPLSFDQPLLELHAAARRKVLRIDETLDALITELEEEPPF
jgi:hypothetical protein